MDGDTTVGTLHTDKIQMRGKLHHLEFGGHNPENSSIIHRVLLSNFVVPVPGTQSEYILKPESSGLDHFLAFAKPMLFLPKSYTE